MNICISNIAWKHHQEKAAAKLLQSLGVTHVEIAPTAAWERPLGATKQERAHYRQFWEDHGIRISAMQSLVYGRSDLILFGTEDIRQQFLEYLEDIIILAEDLGAQALVLGSPKNRLRGDFSLEEAHAIAVPFFKQLGSFAALHHTAVCLEANPNDYGGDYIIATNEMAELVQRVDNPGFRAHLDTGGMRLAGEDPAASVAVATPYLRHFHLSEPFLGPVGINLEDEYQKTIATQLQQSGYTGLVSIEMRCPDDESHALAQVEQAVRFAQQLYPS